MRRLAFLFLLCVSVDFANPMLPGSQRFDLDESVEAVHADRFRASGHVTAMAAPAQAVRFEPTRAPQLARPGALARVERPRWADPVPRPRREPPAPASPSEEH